MEKGRLRQPADDLFRVGWWREKLTNESMCVCAMFGNRQMEDVSTEEVYFWDRDKFGRAGCPIQFQISEQRIKNHKVKEIE